MADISAPTFRAVDQPLRVGLILDSFEVPAWIAKVIDQLGDANFVDIVLIVLEEEQSPPPRRCARLRSPWRQRLLFDLYHLIDERLFVSEPDAFARRNIAGSLAAVPVLPVTPSRPTHRLPKHAADQIRRSKLDVLFKFGSQILPGDMLGCAHFGVWSYRHCDSRKHRGGPEFFWEMYERNPVTGTILQVHSEAFDRGRVLYRSFSATDPTSRRRGRNAAYWKSAEFALRCLARLHKEGWERFPLSVISNESGDGTEPFCQAPTNTQMLGFGTRLLLRGALRRIDRLLFAQRWYIAYRRLPSGAIPLPASTPPQTARFRRIAMCRGRYYADPCVVEDGDRYHVFFEDYDVGSGKGAISVTRLDDDGLSGGSVVALQRDYHLSYPFVFHHGSDWYLLPETYERRTIELYRAMRFPDRWALEHVLLTDLAAVDPTLLEHDGRFWLFACVAVPGAQTRGEPAWDELSLFYADSLLGEWHAHPMNPIVSDVRRARPAGRILDRDGQLIRPAQDGSVSYGRAVVFNRITRLTESEYEEEPIGRLQPRRTWRAIGAHTYTAIDSWEVVDGQRRWLRRST